jgi:Zn-dependent oligopeptidase
MSAAAEHASVNPPGLRWDMTPAEVTAEGEAIIRDCTAVLDRVGALAAAPESELSFSAVIAPLIALDRDVEARNSSATFVKNVSTDKEVRDAAAAAQAALSAFEVKAGMRTDVFFAVSRYAAKAATGGELAALPAEERRFVERALRDFRRRGLHLPEPTRKQVEALQTRISDLCVAFQQTLAEDATKLYFTAEQLAGMPADFIAGLAEVDAATALGEKKAAETAGAPAPAIGNIEAVRATVAAAPGGAGPTFREVTMAYPHVVPLMKLAAVPATRAAVERAFNSRAVPSNVAVLAEVVQLRRYVAHLLGYTTHAAYVLEERMALTPEAVEKFLADLGRDLRPLHVADLASLGALKAAEQGSGAGPVGMADYRYYMEAELKDKYAVR